MRVIEETLTDPHAGFSLHTSIESDAEQLPQDRLDAIALEPFAPWFLGPAAGIAGVPSL